MYVVGLCVLDGSNEVRRISIRGYYVNIFRGNITSIGGQFMNYLDNYAKNQTPLFPEYQGDMHFRDICMFIDEKYALHFILPENTFDDGSAGIYGRIDKITGAVSRVNTGVPLWAMRDTIDGMYRQDQIPQTYGLSADHAFVGDLEVPHSMGSQGSYEVVGSDVPYYIEEELTAKFKKGTCQTPSTANLPARHTYSPWHCNSKSAPPPEIVEPDKHFKWGYKLNLFTAHKLSDDSILSVETVWKKCKADSYYGGVSIYGKYGNILHTTVGVMLNAENHDIAYNGRSSTNSDTSNNSLCNGWITLEEDNEIYFGEENRFWNTLFGTDIQWARFNRNTVFSKSMGYMLTSTNAIVDLETKEFGFAPVGACFFKDQLITPPDPNGKVTVSPIKHIMTLVSP